VLLLISMKRATHSATAEVIADEDLAARRVE
jgi:hypothetical protein